MTLSKRAVARSAAKASLSCVTTAQRRGNGQVVVIAPRSTATATLPANIPESYLDFKPHRQHGLEKIENKLRQPVP